MLQIILKYRLRQIYNAIARSKKQKKLELLVPLVLVPYFVTMARTMSHIYKTTYETYGWQKLSEIAIGNMAIICFFVFISTLVLTLYRLPQSKDVPLLMSLPVRDGAFFGVKIVEAFEDTLRGAILPLPIVIAFASVIAKIASPFYAVIFVIAWVFILLQIASLSLAFSLIIGRFVASPKWSYLLRVIAIVSALAIIMIFMRYYRDVDIGSSPVPLLSMMSGNSIFAFFPVTWLVDFIPHEGSNFFSQIRNGLGFVLITIAFSAIARILFRLRFQQLWMETREISQRKKQQRIKSRNYRQMGSTLAFFHKELTVIKRDPHLLIGLLVPIIMFPAFMLFKDQQQQTQVLYITLVSFLGTVAYTLSSIGREGQTFALLRSLPIKISVILRAKFSLSLMLNLTVTLAFIAIFSLTRRLTMELIYRNLLIGLASSVFFSSLGIALASLFPRLDYTNPMRAIEVPGLYSFYIIAMLFIGSIMVTTYGNWILMVLVFVFWGIIAGILLRLGVRKLERMDV